MTALDTSTAAEIEQLIINPPDRNPYNKIKQELIKAFGKTQEEKDMAILNLSGLGDRKPSALLRCMSSLNSNPETLFRALFLMQLPVEIRRVLAANNTTSIAELADKADRIMAAGKNISVINSIYTAYVEKCENPTITDVSAVHTRHQFQHNSTQRKNQIRPQIRLCFW